MFSRLSDVFHKYKLKFLRYKRQFKIFLLILVACCVLSFSGITDLSFGISKTLNNKVSVSHTTPLTDIAIDETGRASAVKQEIEQKADQILSSTNQIVPIITEISQPSINPNIVFVPPEISPANTIANNNTAAVSISANVPIHQSIAITTLTTETGPFGSDLPANETLTKDQSPQPLWTWKCISDRYCTKVQRSLSMVNRRKISREVCWLTCCGPRRNLWPYPSVKSDLGKQVTSFYSSDLKLVKYGAEKNDADSSTLKLFQDAYEITFRHISNMLPSKPEENEGQTRQSSASSVEIHLRISGAQESDINMSNLSLVTDESYTLSIHEAENVVHVLITGKTFFGVRHGLESLTQLIVPDSINDCLQILNKVDIEDKPAYPYRGLMVDSARNFIPIPVLKRIIDGMSFNKLNMFHWHLTDSNSFSFYSKSVPKMTQYGAYSEQEIYRPDEIQDFVQYARLRGVKVIPELDAPSHAGHGWEWGPEAGLENLALCINSEPWRSYCGQPPCGQLNPVNSNVYDILELIYKDMFELFDNDVFHMGGDEVTFRCWDTPDIKNWMNTNKVSDIFSAWKHFQWEALKRLRKASKHSRTIPILWNSGLTNKPFTPKLLDPTEYILQIWDASNDVVDTLVESGYPLIFSNVGSLYLDWGSGSWLGNDHNYAYTNWQKIYDFNRQFKGKPYNKNRQVENQFYGSLPQILGGEGTMWTEKADEDNIEIKIFPRMCALAESLWSDPPNRSGEVYTRLLIQSDRMRARGVRVDRRQPKSCDQFEGHCDDLGRSL